MIAAPSQRNLCRQAIYPLSLSCRVHRLHTSATLLQRQRELRGDGHEVARRSLLLRDSDEKLPACAVVPAFWCCAARISSGFPAPLLW